MFKIAVESKHAFWKIPLDDIELVHSPFPIVSLLARQKEVPLLAVSKNCERNALVKRILEELALGTLALPQLFDLDKGNWFAGGMAQGEIDPAPFE